jgi:hypothetical protein
VASETSGITLAWFYASTRGLGFLGERGSLEVSYLEVMDANIMKMFNKFAVAATTAAIAAFSVPSNAITLTNGGSYNFSWDVTSGAGNLKGDGTISVVSGIGTNSLVLDVTLNNLSALASIRLVSWGFSIDPNATGVAFSDSDSVGIKDAYLAGLPGQPGLPSQSIEVCAFAGNNCAGGAGDGLFGIGGTPTSDTFRLTLAGTWATPVNLDPMAFKYQTAVGSYEFSSSSGIITSGGRPVPEPSSSLVLLGLGALGMAFVRRRKANA